MGGRGATNATYLLNGKAHKYGDEYRAVGQVGEVKFVVMLEQERAIGGDSRVPGVKAPTDSMTPGRIYATISLKTNELHSLSFIGADGKQAKRLDYREHRGMKIHVHEDYNGRGNIREPNEDELRMAHAMLGIFNSEYKR